MKIYITLVLLLGLILPSKGQWIDTLYKDQNYKNVDQPSVAAYYFVWESTDSLSPAGKYSKFNINGVLLEITNYEDFNKNIKSGTRTTYFTSGQIKAEETYLNGRLDGKIQTFYKNGQLKRHDIYNQGEFVEGKCFTKTGADTTHYPYEKLPVFPGGVEALYAALAKQIIYPPETVENNISGTVYITFYVDELGNVGGAFVKISVHPQLDQVSLDAVNSLPRWTPGELDGEPVKVYYTVPIKFETRWSLFNRKNKNGK